MNRRDFGLAVAGLGLTSHALAQQRIQVDQLLLSHNGWMPNNAYLPVLHYRRAFRSNEVADRMEGTFMKNQWPAQWRNGVYTFHHYHSTAHEVLGFAAGSARLLLGGAGGHPITAEAGDVLVLPTGTGHCLLQASPDLLVVGAYPVDQHWDICRAAPDGTALMRMRHLPFPASDPLTGTNGDLVRAWSAS